jgi:acetyl-CoA carboxylase carboxyl transferase subunit beta
VLAVNWLTDFVRPRLESLVKRDTPENLWTRCASCEQMIFSKELAENLWVCKHCQNHMPITAIQRADMLYDDAQYKKQPLPKLTEDPLKFKDSKRYTDRLKEARKKADEAIMLTTGLLNSRLVVMAIFDFRFIGGSMNTVVGETLLKGADEAARLQCPYITITSSGGARMQEGILSLMQMPRSILGTLRLKKARLPFISILAHPTTGGVAASFATLGDLNISEPKAVIGFAGARVIQQTALARKLPADFQSAEFQQKHGLLDAIVHRHQLKEWLARTLSVLMPNESSARKVS